MILRKTAIICRQVALFWPINSPGFVSVSLNVMPFMEVAVFSLRFIFQADITHTIYWPAFLSLAGFLRGPSLRLPLRFSLSTLKSAFLLSSLFLPASSLLSLPLFTSPIYPSSSELTCPNIKSSMNFVLHLIKKSPRYNTHTIH